MTARSAALILQFFRSVRAERVAIAIEGPAGRLLPESLQSIFTNVIQRFDGCDVFVVSPYQIKEGQNQEETENEIHRSLSPLGKITASDISQDMPREKLQEFFISSLSNDLNKEAMLYYFSDHRKTIDSSWVQTDNVQNDRNLRYFLNKRSLYKLIEKHETDNNFRYDRVIFQRSDMYYYAPHPPMDMLSSEYVWIPEGQDWGGLNDRHAVIPRRFLERYLLRWDSFVSGDLPRWYEMTEWVKTTGVWNEMYLFLALSSLRGTREEVKVARFLPVAHIKCCTNGQQCLHRPCQDRTQGWRYQSEGSDALKVAALVKKGWQWHVVKRGEDGSRKFQPECFQNEGFTAKRCCDESVYVGGPKSCWPEGSEILSFDTCCRPDHPQLSLKPPQQNKETGNVCWALQSSATMDTYVSCISKGLPITERVAICTIGPSDMYTVNIEIAERAVGPLDADLFLVVNKYRPSLSWTYDEGAIRHWMGNYGKISGVKHFDSLEGGDDLLKGLLEDRGSNIHFLFNETGSLIYNKGRVSAGVWELFAKRECYSLIVEHEQKHNFKYDRIISIRENFLLGSNHPALDLMSDQYLWLSEGGDRHGLNDRHAVIPRRYAQRYFMRFDSLLSGRFEKLFRLAKWKFDTMASSLSEILLLLETWDPGNPIPVARFLPVGVMLCCDTNIPEVYSTSCQAKGCKRLLSGVDDEIELRDVQGVTHLLKDGWLWHNTTRGKSFSRLVHPDPCHNFCCNGDTFGLNSCWEGDGFDFISHDFCCRKSIQLSIRPPADSKWQGSCWELGIDLSTGAQVQSCVDG